jgi:hypothetical protein
MIDKKEKQVIEKYGKPNNQNTSNNLLLNDINLTKSGLSLRYEGSFEYKIVQKHAIL